MEIERVSASLLTVGDTITTSTSGGWFAITDIATDDAGEMTLTLERFEDSRRSTWTLTGDQIVRRAEPGAVHHRDEFLGMTLREAQAWAGALGWGFRDRSASDFVTDDLRTDRINVWTDERGVVIRTEMS